MEPRIAADTSTGAGDLRSTPFPQLLVELFHAGQTGTLYLQRHGDAPTVAIRFESGMPVRTRSLRADGDLVRALVPLCGRVGGAFAFASGEDGVAAGPGIVEGRADPRAVIAAAARGPLRSDVIAEVMAGLGRSLLRLNPRADLDVYAFTAEERRIVDCLAEGPLDFAELTARSAAPGRVLQRLVYVLTVTRALTVLPAVRRMQSGTVAHAAAPEPPAPQSAPVLYSVAEPERSVATAVDDYGADDADAPILIEIEEAAPENASRRPVAAQARVHQERAELLLRQQRHREALREARQALKLGGSSAPCLTLYAWALYQVNGAGSRVHPRVWEHLEHAIKRDPQYVRAHVYKAQLLKRVGRPEESHWHFRRALQLEPGNLEAAREVRLHEMRKRHSQPSGLVARLLERLR